jgi:cob(I)alamin adenosyltransferase
MNQDYSFYETQILPLSRQLYEHMIRREWEEAEKYADQLSDCVFEMKRICIKNQVCSGEGWKHV